MVWTKLEVMDNLLMSVDELSKKMEENGFGYFNFYNGLIGAEFKSGLLAHIQDPNVPDFPIYAFTPFRATNPDEPYGTARFSIIKDQSGRLQINAIKSSLYENCEGALMISETLDIKSLLDLPTKEQLNNHIEKAWQKHVQENKAKRENLKAARNRIRGRKL